ncbi:putative phosphoenolpyruvate synthase isoform X2 [Frankliniella occidentalis]|uniref:Phosphoenolpyruvate synthase isoform X2 n=1 Tax=Frankliniella occidentalis TaxID=133901 RepID=A0A9C6X406_FRAOC|nr:putative phosphoenolpyruvate synthase isoform X2 [Frankliniella occidentalis]
MLWLLPYLVWLSPAAFLYWLVFAAERPRATSSPYSQPAWNFPLKRVWALLAVRRLKAKRLAALSPSDPAAARQAQEEAVYLPTEYERRLEEPRLLLAEGIVDSLCFHGADFHGGYLVVRMTRMRHCLARVALQLKLGDTVYQLPQMPDSLMSRTGAAWSAGGDWGSLRLEVVEPLRTWRLAFNGVLREGAPRSHQDWDGLPGDQGCMRHVRLNFLWHACSKEYNCRHDWSAEMLADTLAREPWRSDHWMDIIKGHVGGYDQWGTLHGEVRVEGAEAVEVYLRGLRQRRWGPNEAGRLHRRLTVSGVLKNGTMFSVGADCHPGQLSHATYGHVRTAEGDLRSITSTSLSLPDLAEDKDHIPKHFVLQFTAGGVHYTSAVHLPRTEPCTVLCERPWSWLMLLEPAECSLEWRGAEGVMEGVGLAELCYRYDGPCALPAAAPAPALHLRESKTLPGRLLLDLEERACRSTALVGGKGASLAVLTALATDKSLEGSYVVPGGFCLTVTALERQLASFPALREAVEALAAAAAESSAEGVDAALSARCEAVVALFDAEAVCEAVAVEVRAALARLDGDGGVLWAVRSSAVGEDSDELSAAGQNATFLGCRGDDGVLDGVRRCWASLFALQSVQYRRQHAQPVNAPMAVVVQRMVAADTAGVLFTCDPSSGDPRKLLITANYGLGESVVSAAVDPDVVVVQRDMAGAMSVVERRTGDKKHRVVLAASGGVREEAVAQSASSVVCLSDDEALALARAGARLERAFGGARDVEWAFASGRLHLLQSRPVTALFNWTDFELLHEQDTPWCSDEEVCSTANTGEVMPGASSPLCLTTVTRGCDMCTARASSYKEDVFRRFNTCIPVTHNHVTINVLNLMLRNVGRELDLGIHVVDLTIYGHRATTPAMHRAALRRHGCRIDALTRVKLFYEVGVRAWNASKMVQATQKLTRELDLHEKAAREATARGVLRLITEAMPTLTESFSYHAAVSNVSSFSQVVAVMVLTEGAKDLSTEHITDVASMLSCTGGDVVSAQIPPAMEAIAKAVRDGCPQWRDFLAVPPEQGMRWLEEHCPKAHRMTATFLDQFGCRVIREFDPKTVTWDEEPSKLIASLQPLVGNPQNHDRPAASTVQEVVERLKSPKKGFTRFLLRRLLPWFQGAVVNREFTKEGVIQLIHKFRQAFRRLGVLLEKEGRLPDRALTPFLTLWELQRIACEQPDPAIIAKARRRRRCWPEWDALAFPEIMHGVPQPEKFEEPDASGTGEVVAQGTPVSESSVTARACVVLALDGDQGVSQLRAGDVLITHSTDVGWSPYFPMLGGVVTELGGLISHGAVVAREYGLPCLVGVYGATRMFKTGDIVKISGKTGALSKVK